MSIPNIMDENDRLKAVNTALAEQLKSQQCITCEIITPEVVAGLHKEIATLKKLLSESDGCLAAFPAHYEAATEKDAVSFMIQRDMWLKFRVRVMGIRDRIKKALR
jgi:hypothetical protein